MVKYVGRSYDDYLIDIGDTVEFTLPFSEERVRGEVVRVYFGSGYLHALYRGQHYEMYRDEATKIFPEDEDD